MARHILIIANPAAGRKRRGNDRLRRVVAALEERGCRVAVLETRGPGEAERLAQTADPAFDVIVAAGGDGTVNEVANGLRWSLRPLAVVPLGTGNVLASEIGMPNAPEAIARVIAETPAQPIWPGVAGDRLFVAMVGIGFDAEVLSAPGVGLKWRIGKLAYVWAILWCLCRYRRRDYIVGACGEEQHAASVIIVKGRRYAGNFMIASAARLAEPILYVVLFRQAGRLAALRGLAAMLSGTLDRRCDVSVFAAAELDVALAENSPAASCPTTPGLVEIDGEVAGVLPLAIRIAETPLLLLQPRA